MASVKSSPEDLLKILRQPKSTQQCRDLMPCSSVDTEDLLLLLRDQGVIAYANGAWYVIDSSRLLRAPRPKKEDPRQEKLFK
jgi:hypothetical protein